jgi:hypothetical protein
MKEDRTSDNQQLNPETEHSSLIIFQTQAEIERLTAYIQWMETSKFWKLRTLWLKILKFLSLDFSDELKSNLASWFDSNLEINNQESYEGLDSSGETQDTKRSLALLGRIALRTLLSSNHILYIPTSPEPEITIILVLFNRAELTYHRIL